MPLGELKIVFLGHPGVKFQDTELGVVPNFMFLAYTHVLGVRNQIPFDEFKVELPISYLFSSGVFSFDASNFHIVYFSARHLKRSIII